MYLKSNNWEKSWRKFKETPLKKALLNEASPGFVHGVNNWIDTVTDGGEYTLNEVLPWNDMFDGALRVAVPAGSEDDTNLAKIVTALHMGGWRIPELAGGGPGIKDFTVTTVKQKKRRLGTGEVYEEEIPVAKLDLARTERKEIPKGPRAGEWVTKTETTTMSRAINRLTKVDSDLNWYISPKLAAWWQKKQTFYTKGEHWKKIEKLFNEPSEDGLKSDQMIVYSRHPIDVLRMGDVETVGSLGTAGKIGHCHAEGGEYAHCAQQEALGHGPIAYLVDKKEIDFLLSGETQEERTKNYLSGGPETAEPKYKLSDFDDREIFNDRDRDIKGIKAINRLRLRQYRDNEINEMWAVPEKAVYPSWDVIPGFSTAVQEWAWDRQKKMYEEGYKAGEFPDFDAIERLGGKYGDTRDGQLLNAFFNRSGKYPDYAPQQDVHHEREESEDLEPDPEMIAEEWDNQVQNILEVINGRMDHASVYAEVEVMEETPYVMMSAGLAVEFNEDLFGSDGGAEYELPTSYGDQGYNDLTSELGEELRNQIHVYADDVDINDWNNTISFNFNIMNEDYDPNPQGFDSFADYIESEWDNNYDAIRKVIKRHLIKEEYMAPDAYEKLAQGLRAKAEERDLADAPAYKHWDFDEDGNEITFILKDPATLVAEPDFHGLYLGAIPKSMDLSYIFHDWKFRSSKEFEDKFIPRIRTLFADAEEAALRQLDLPGVEAKEMHGLLLPEKAEFRLKQVFDDYSKPAHIYLQVKIEIDEEITDMQVEEIQLFLKYLDEDSKIDILQKGAEETFQEFLRPAIKKRAAADKVSKFGDTIQPLLKQIPIEQLMNFVGNLPLLDTGIHRSVSSVTHEMATIIVLLAPRHEGGKPTNQFTGELYKRWTVDIIAQARKALPRTDWFDDDDEAWHRVRTIHNLPADASDEEIDKKIESLYEKANKILGIRLQDSSGASHSSWNPAALLEKLHQGASELVVTGANQISYVFDLIMRDPRKAGGVDLLKKIMKPDYAPSWYAKELQKAGIASERIVDILPVSALDNPRTQEHEDSVNQIMKLLNIREAVSLRDRIDEA